jgi:hypothetical protein
MTERPLTARPTGQGHVKNIPDFSGPLSAAGDFDEDRSPQRQHGEAVRDHHGLQQWKYDVIHLYGKSVKKGMELIRETGTMPPGQR